MALITEGFEGALMPAGWTSLDAGDAAASIAGFSGNAAQLTNSAFTYGGYVSGAFSATTLITLDLYFRANFFMYAASNPVVQLRSGTTPLIGIIPSGAMGSWTFDLYQYSGTTGSSVATTVHTYAEAAWIHLHLVAALTNGGTATLTVDGVQEIVAMGMYGNGAAGATKLFLGTAPFTNLDYDSLDLSVTGGGGGGGSSVGGLSAMTGTSGMIT